MEIKEENREEITANAFAFLERPAAYHANEEYVADVIKLFHLLERPAYQAKAAACMQYLNARIKLTGKGIALEKELEKYKLAPVEKFSLLKLAYMDVMGGRFARMSRRDLFQFLINTGLCPIEQAVRCILQPSAPIYKQGLVLCSNGGISLSRELAALFIGGKRGRAGAQAAGAEKLPKCSMLSIYQGLNRFVIGQEQAKRALASAVYEHFLRCKIARKEGRPMEKNNMLLIGPTGTGKTYLCRVLAQILHIPFYMADASQMTDTGYVGPSVGSVLMNLQKQIPDMGNVFPPSIVYLDEIDKLAAKDTPKDISGRGVQEEMLKLLESSVYTVAADRFREAQQYDISNVMFIAGGAFAGIEHSVARRQRKHQIGFGNKTGEAVGPAEILPSDLEDYGFMPELVGRFTHISRLNPLTRQDLENILGKAKNNPLEQYKRIFDEAGIRLRVPRNVLGELARQALANKTGARGLKSILSNLLSAALFECQLHKKKEYLLTLKE